MRFEIYLAIGGADFDAAAFALEANKAKARTRRIGELGAKIRPGVIEPWTVWESERVKVSEPSHADIQSILNTHYIGDDVKRLLLAHCDIQQLIDAHRERVECWVTILCIHAEKEEPRGLSLDKETINLLSQFNASIEIDAVYETA